MNLSCFLEQNAIPVSNVKFLASKRFLDDESNPVMWEIKAVKNELDEELRRTSAKRVSEKKGALISEVDHSLYLCRLAAECTVFPDLSDAALQDSYGVMGKENLLKAMLTPGEYSDYLLKVQEVNGFNIDFSEKVNTAKN